MVLKDERPRYPNGKLRIPFGRKSISTENSRICEKKQEHSK
jgi:hypothetical protein